MNATIIAFFNNKGGVGKTTLVYHLAWMFQDLGVRVVASDLDPQANLTAAFVPENQLEELWPGESHPRTLMGAIQPLVDATGDVTQPWVEKLSPRLGLLIGDIGLSSFEDQLSEVWPKCMIGDKRALRVTSSFWRVMQAAAQQLTAELVLMDLGPNLGAINRAALLAADYVVIPLSPDLFSLQGLRNLGPMLRTWRTTWSQIREHAGAIDFQLPPGAINPAGYLVQQHSIRLDRPVMAYQRWIDQIPSIYRGSVLDQHDGGDGIAKDSHCIAQIKHYRSLIPIAQEARKPMFYLKPGDGAMGSQFLAAKDSYKDFRAMARAIAERCGIKMPQPASAEQQ